MAIFASDIQRTILEYYGEDSTIWQRMQTGQATEQEIIRALGSAPQVQPVYSIDGNYVLGYDWAEPKSADLSNINFIVDNADSNAGQYGYSNNGVYLNIPSNWSGTSGNYSVNSGATLTSSGSRLATIADKASLAVTGVNLGAKLGAAIDNALYNIDPQWWDTHYPTINPQTWTSLATSDGGKQFVRTLFGIPQMGQTTAYVDERILAQTYQMLRDAGAFDSGATYPTYQDSGSYTISSMASTENMVNEVVKYLAPSNLMSDELVGIIRNFISDHEGDLIITAIRQSRTGAGKSFFYIVANPNYGVGNTIYLGRSIDGSMIRGYGYRYVDDGPLDIQAIYTTGSPPSWMKYIVGTTTVTVGSDTYIVASNIDATISDGVPGIRPNAIGTSPSPTIITGTTVNQVLQQLKENYPQLFDGSITYGTMQPDGTIDTTTAVPVPWAVTETETEGQPITKEETEISTQVDDKVLVDTVTKIEDRTTDPSDTGDGNTPTVVLPTGSASSLWAVYHPSQSQLNAFGAWLWSSDFVEQIKKLFMDPMQAIIGVHKVFAPIPTGGSQNIKCGYLDSGVSSPTVSSQYTTVDCGTVKLSEYFGNVFDYDPHTKVSIYLPFIGVVPLKVSEVMRSSISVSYGVDVITGACLAKVSVNRDGAGGILYTYGGSCACHYPISSGSYAGIISGIVTSAMGIATGIATGSPLAAIGGTIAGVRQMRADVQHSGGFTGCSGAMGPKKPYLIITRPQTRTAANVQNFFGKPSNATMTLGECSGYVRVKHAHIIAPGAYDEELKEIETLLQNGVIISN